MDEKKINEFGLEIGDVVIGIICPTPEYAASFSEYFNTPNSAKRSDITLKLNFIPHAEEIDIPESLFTTKKVTGNSIDIASGLVHGEVTGGNAVDLWVKIGLTHGQSTRVFEQILYQAYYSACKLKKSDSLLIHCSGVIHNGDGFLFVGPSGSGKSTIADLSKNYHVLNDEICVINFNDSGITLQGTPLNGYYKNKKSGFAALKAIFLIKHGKSNVISEIKRIDAVKQLAKEIVPPIGLDEALNQNIFINMLDMADRIYGSIPVYKLAFLQDSSFWTEIDKFFYS